MATFGKTNVGTFTNGSFGTSPSAIGVSQFLAPDSNMVVSKLTVRQTSVQVAISTAASSIRGLIYADDGFDKPSSLLAITQETSTVATQNNVWLSLPFSPEPELPVSGKYWLGIMANGRFTTASSIAGLNSFMDTVSYPTVTSTYSETTENGNQKSIYATYSSVLGVSVYLT